MSGTFEEVLKNDNKFGNSILRAFLDSRLDAEKNFQKINTTPTKSDIMYLVIKEGGQDNGLQCNRCMSSCD